MTYSCTRSSVVKVMEWTTHAILLSLAARTKFPMSTLKRLGFGARPPGANGGAGLPKPKKRKAPPTNEAEQNGGARPSPQPAAVAAAGTS